MELARAATVAVTTAVATRQNTHRTRWDSSANGLVTATDGALMIVLRNKLQICQQLHSKCQSKCKVDWLENRKPHT